MVKKNKSLIGIKITTNTKKEESRCSSEACTRIWFMKNQNIRVRYQLVYEDPVTVVVKGVTVGADAPVAREMPAPAANFDSVLTGDMQPMDCAKHN